MESLDIEKIIQEELNDILVSKVKEAIDDERFICEWTEKGIKSNAKGFSRYDKQRMIRLIDYYIESQPAGLDADQKEWLGLRDFLEINL